MKVAGEGYWKYIFDLRFHPEAGSERCKIPRQGDPQSLYHGGRIIIVGGQVNLRTGEAWWIDSSDQPYPKFSIIKKRMQVLSKEGDFSGVAMYTGRYDETEIEGPIVVRKIGTYYSFEYRANAESA